MSQQKAIIKRWCVFEGDIVEAIYKRQTELRMYGTATKKNVGTVVGILLKELIEKNKLLEKELLEKNKQS